jgi:hypothetical protein
MGCESDSGFGSDETFERVNLVAKIDFPVLQDDSKELKRVTSDDVDGIYLTVFDSQSIYYNDMEFKRVDEGWEINLYNLPIGRDITFIAEALNENKQVILQGKSTTVLETDTSSVIIPISLSFEEPTISMPTIENNSVNANGDGTTNITFTVINPNSDKVTWRIYSDPVLPESISFQPIDGKIVSDNDTQYIEGEIDFSATNGDSEKVRITLIGETNNLIYSNNKFEITNSLGDVTSSIFSIYSPRDEIGISIAPIVDNIYLTFYQDKILAQALIFADFPRFDESSAYCTNDYTELRSISFADQTFEELMRHYYVSVHDGTYEGIDVNYTISILNTVEILDEDGYFRESNFTKLMKVDINDSWESLFGELQDIYYADTRIDPDDGHLSFDELKIFLYDDGFQEMLSYYTGEKKLITAMKNFYRQDLEIITIINSYQRDISDFNTFLEFIVNPPSTMMEDYQNGGFVENGEYYYSKFKATTDEEKENLHLFIEKIEDASFQYFLDAFNSSGYRLYHLMYEYYKEDVYDSRFAKLLDFRIDETKEALLISLDPLFATKSVIYQEAYQNFQILEENRDFKEYLEYYTTQESVDPQLENSIQSKYDDTVCNNRIIEENVDYFWKFASDPDNLLGSANPLVIEDFYGTIDDTLLLEVKNIEGISATYSVDLNIKHYHDSDGNPLIIEVEDIDENVTYTDTTDDTNSSLSIGDPEYRFELYSNISSLELIYGETKTVRFVTNVGFEDFRADIIGSMSFIDYEIFQRDSTIFDVEFTAKSVEGTESFDFIVQNDGHTEVEQIQIDVIPPVINVKVDGKEVEDDVASVVSVYESKLRTVPIEATSPRGHKLKFSFTGVDISNFGVEDNGSNTFSSGTSTGITYGLLVKALLGSVGEANTVTLIITDEEVGKSEMFKITLVSTEYIDLSVGLKECKYRGATLQLDDYEYTAATIDDGRVVSEDNMFQLQSFNVINYSENMAFNDYLSKMVVLHDPLETETTKTPTYKMDIYNYYNHELIGEIRYTEDAKGDEFYIKYVDNSGSTNQLICEKHSFPSDL